MSASSSRQSRSNFAEASYAVNWRAIWTATSVVALLVSFGVARLVWPSARQVTGSPSVAETRRAAPYRRLLPPRALIPQQVELALAGPISVLDVPVWTEAKTQKSAPITAASETAHSEPAVTSVVSSNRDVGGPSNLRDPIHVFDDPPDRLWPESAYPRGIGALTEDLQARSVELDLSSISGIEKEASAKLIKGRGNGELTVFSGSPTIPELVSRHAELAGIPFRRGEACRRSADEAKLVQQFSLQLHRFTDVIASHGSISGREIDLGDPGIALKEESKLVAALNIFLHRGSMGDNVHSSILVQMLQPFDQSVGIPLVNQLGEIKTAGASEALAERAIYDLSPIVRRTACEALSFRPRAEFRETLIAGLRYPWAPVAIHAAQALVAVDDRQTMPQLSKMVNAPDPSLPVKNEKGEWVKSELVRINHLRNCYLCHAPSNENTDLVRGAVPIPGEPLPRVYYGSREGNFVRADVTYLKQDFSLTQQVKKTDKDDRWPEFQRFDYVARTRPATDEEIAGVKKLASAAEQSVDYPQRLAVMFAIEGLMQPPRTERPRPAVAANK
jgi:hypothetical protein